MEDQRKSGRSKVDATTGTPTVVPSAPTSVRSPGVAGDIWGGLAAMLVALPSAIAFGVAIFSPLGSSLSAQGAIAGIIGTIVLGLIAPFAGGSTRLITAPCAPAAAVLSALAIGFTQDQLPPQQVLLLLGLIALLAGMIQIGLGVAGIGRLIKFIPFPVVSGYLSGVGIIIIGSQIPKFLGAPAGSSLLAAIQAPGDWAWQSIVVGSVVIAAMTLTPRLTRAVPAAILALLAGVAAYLGLALLDPALLQTHDNPLLVGALTSGNDSLVAGISLRWESMSSLGLDAVVKVLLPAMTLAVLLSIDTLKTCLVIDAMTNSHHNSNRELIGQGLGNIGASLAGGIPGAGTMGASLISISSGGSTKLSGLMTGLFALAAFLLLSPLIAWIPVAALAAILMVIGVRMIDRHSLTFFYSPATRLDFLVILSVILVAVFGNLIAASGVGVALAILIFIREQTRSSVIRSRIEGQEIFSKRTHLVHDAERIGRESSRTVVFELQGSLFFGTASQLHDALEQETGSRKYVILNMRRVQSLDVTATHVLEQIKDQLEENNAYLVFCDIPKGLPSGLKMKRFLKETGVVRPTNKAFAFRELEEALEWVEAREMEDSERERANAITIDLPQMPFLASFSPEVISELGAKSELRHVKAGKKVFKKGTDDRELFILRRGSVKVTVPLHKKTNYHLATCGPGEIIGGMGFLEGKEHAADAQAITDVEAYVIARDEFDRLVALHPDLGMVLIEIVAHNLSSRLRVAIGELQALRG